MVDIDKLEAMANEFDDRSWTAPGLAELWDSAGPIGVFVDVSPVCEESRPTPSLDQGERIAQYCASANPAVMLELISELRRLREEVWERPLCESHRVVLHIGQGYRFIPDPNCESCMRMKREHDEAYGPLRSDA